MKELVKILSAVVIMAAVVVILGESDDFNEMLIYKGIAIVIAYLGYRGVKWGMTDDEWNERP